MPLTDNKTWEQLWKKWLVKYNSGAPRFSYYMHIILNILSCENNNKIHEYGCGSGRNVINMKKLGWDITGSDFSEYSINQINSNYKQLFKILDYTSNENNEKYDITTHDGFFVCFPHNKWYSLIDKQLSLTNKYAFIGIHNFQNKNLMKRFNELKTKDNLYDITWFDHNKIINYIKEKYSYEVKLFYMGYMQNMDSIIKEMYNTEFKPESINYYKKLMTTTPIEKIEKLIICIKKN